MTKFQLFAALIVTAIGFAAASSGLARGADTKTCGEFIIYIKNSKVSFFDIEPEGISTGDRRLGRYDIVDEAGNQLGSFVFTGTIMPPSGNGKHQLHAVAHYSLESGSISTSMVYEMNDASNTTTTPDQQFVYPVTGGTGSFAGARGILVSSKDSKGRRAHTFDLTCGE